MTSGVTSVPIINTLSRLEAGVMIAISGEGLMERPPELSFLLTKNSARYHPPQARLNPPPPAQESDQRPVESSSPWKPRNPKFRFIDLFAGIGGFRIAFEQAGGECVFTSEWDLQAQKTYKANFGEVPAGDIRQVDPAQIAPFDILVAGFPCQPFSIAGVSKKNALGRAHGFKDKTQGTLFFDLLRILSSCQPRAFVLENVKNLRSHDGGRTYATIIDQLTRLGYHVFDKIVDAQSVVPQHRERIFIVGFREFRPFDFPELPNRKPRLSSILERKISDKYFLSAHLWKYLQAYAEKHRAKGNGFGCSVTERNGVARTLSARYYKDGSEILVESGKSTPRRLTPRECANLMGFPAEFKIVVADTPAYKQFGNAVVVPVARAVAASVVKAMGAGRSWQLSARKAGPPALPLTAVGTA